MKALVAGWFSFPQMGATAGDLLSKDVVCGWLTEAGFAVDVALAAPFDGGVDWNAVDPEVYGVVVFVCGPFGNGWPIPDFLERFKGKRLIGVNLSMLQPLDQWNPFDVLFERDSSVVCRPDVSFLSDTRRVPVVGVVLVHPQREYSESAHTTAGDAIERLMQSRPMAAVRIDTRLDVNATGACTPAEVESLIARMDVVVTTRLHGLVLALKNHVPVVAIDPIPGGAKVQRQARSLGWPLCFLTDDLSDKSLADALGYALTAEARDLAADCARRGRDQLARVREQFIHSVTPRALV